MKKKILAWWHKQRGYHSAPAGNFPRLDGFVVQKCSCGASRKTIVDTRKGMILYSPRWAA